MKAKTLERLQRANVALAQSVPDFAKSGLSIEALTQAMAYVDSAVRQVKRHLDIEGTVTKQADTSAVYTTGGSTNTGTTSLG